MGMILFNSENKKADNYIWIKKKAVKKEDILKMLVDLKKKHHHEKFILLLDGLAAHWAKIVRDFTQQNRQWLTVYRFPSYAPELNPQEYEWSSLKRKDLGNYSPPTMEDLEKKVHKGHRRMRRNQTLLKGFLKKSGLWSVKELGEEQ
jgi:transposase